VVFRGLIDGLGSWEGDSALFEFKVLGQVSKTTFDTIAFNGQVHSYLSTLPKAKRPQKFVYCVLRKPSKWVKRGQTIAEFIHEMQADLRGRPEFYFAVWAQDCGENAIQHASDDIDAAAEDLVAKYDRLHDKHPKTGLYDEGVLEPTNWARDDRQCHEYGSCPYLCLCKDVDHWKARAAVTFKRREDQFPRT
jgi:hypothetical protein